MLKTTLAYAAQRCSFVEGGGVCLDLTGNEFGEKEEAGLREAVGVWGGLGLWLWW